MPYIDDPIGFKLDVNQQGLDVPAIYHPTLNVLLGDERWVDQYIKSVYYFRPSYYSSWQGDMQTRWRWEVMVDNGDHGFPLGGRLNGVTRWWEYRWLSFDPAIGWWFQTFEKSWATVAEMFAYYGLGSPTPGQTYTMYVIAASYYRTDRVTQEYRNYTWVEVSRVSSTQLLATEVAMPFTVDVPPAPNPTIVPEPYSTAVPAPGLGVDPSTPLDFSVVVQKNPEGGIPNSTGPFWLATVCRGKTVLHYVGAFGYGTPGETTVTIPIHTSMAELSGIPFTISEPVPIGFYCGNGTTPYVTSASWIINYIVNVPIEEGTIALTSNVANRCVLKRNGVSFNWYDVEAGVPKVLAGMPVAVWTVEWGDVAGYTTPPDETKQLQSGGSISFNAVYIGGPDGDGSGTVGATPILAAAGGALVLWALLKRR